MPGPESNPKRDWKITGYDSLTPIFDASIPIGRITTKQLLALLQTLVAKYGLNDAEILACHLKRGTRAYLDHLQVSEQTDGEGRLVGYTCGSNPYFVAHLSIATSPPLD